MDSAPSAALQHPSSTPPSASNSSSAPPTGPQIRSRITVVCAECKRLKLKCDRRAPCGSCTKRDTVVRCIYSPAAAEKVDLHSLHNRLIQVESILSAITSGQTPPAFQSSYPVPQQPAASTIASSSSAPAPSFGLNFSNHQSAHQHHHHYAPPQIHSSANSIALSPQDFASIWLDGLDLGVSWSSPSQQQQQQQVYPNGANTGYIKLEPSTIDVALSLSHSGAPTVIDVNNNTHYSKQGSRPTSPLNSRRLRRSQRQSSSVQFLLPALSIYYPVPSISLPGASPSSSSPFPHQPSNTLHLPPQHRPQYTKPQVTPAILALLPSLERCKRLLHKAREVFQVRPLPFEPSQSPGGAWKAFESRCITLLSGGLSEEKERERERKEKAKQAKRARQIYFGGIAGLQSEDTEMDDASASTSSGTKSKDVEEQHNSGENLSLTLFATLCAVLAIGATYSSSSDSSSTATESPAFFYALSQQALGVWDTHMASTSGSGSNSSNSAADEAERMEYLLACLAGVEYLMLSGAAEERDSEDSQGTPVYSLVGKLVNAHRSMGLGRETSSSFKKGKNSLSGPSTAAMNKRVEKEKAKEEWRRMVLWQVMYCDLFTADALGHQPYIPSYSYSAKLPSCSSLSSSASCSQSEASTGATEEESEDESQQSLDDMQHDGPDSPFNTRIPTPNSIRQRRRQQQQHPQSALPNPHRPDEDTCSYFGARYRLTQLAQAVKDRIVHPDCCCGYTLDQAAGLEDEIRRWYASLPAPLRVASSSSTAAAFVASPQLSDPTVPKSPFYDLLPQSPPDGIASGPAARFGADALAQSCELAIVVNLLIVKIYTPFLRHAASTVTSANSAQTSASTAGLAPGSHPSAASASAYQATIRAAQAILRAGKFLCSLSSSGPKSDDGRDVILPSLFDYYPLDNVIFDAVVICAHVGLTGKAASLAIDVASLLDDVYSGLGLLSDMLAGNGISCGLESKQKRVVEALYKRVQHRAGNASLLKRKHDQVDISGTFGAAPSMYLPADGAAAVSNGEAIAHGFEYIEPSNGIQYQPDGLPIAQQQQQHAHLMDTTVPSSRSSIPPNASIPADVFSPDHQQRSELQKSELRSALTSVAAARAAARHVVKEKSKEQDLHEKEKGQGQKHSKKSHVYPNVGIRVRPGKDGSSASSRSRQQSVSGASTVTATSQSQKPLADTVLAFQQQQKQKSQQQQGVAPTTSGDIDHKSSRSLSFSHVQSQPQSQMEQQQPSTIDFSSLSFSAIPPSNSNLMDPLQNKPFTVPDAGDRHQQQVAPDQPSFNSRPFEQTPSIFDRAQQQSYDATVASSSVPSSDGLSYGNTISSPFSPPGGPPSSTGSPFTSASATSSGHPSTPIFNAHHPAPPVFGPQPSAMPPNSSPTVYFRPPDFGNQYARSPQNMSTHHRNVSLAEMSIDQSMASSTPVYEKSQQQPQVGMYDLKPAADAQTQHHHHHQQQHLPRQSMIPSNSYDGQAMSGQLSMVSSPATSWSPAGQQQQGPLTAQNYWDLGGEYRFHS